MVVTDPGEPKGRYMRVSTHDSISEPPSAANVVDANNEDLEQCNEKYALTSDDDHDDDACGARTAGLFSLVSSSLYVQRQPNSQQDANPSSTSSSRSRWARRKRLPLLGRLSFHRKQRSNISSDYISRRKARRPLRIVLKSLVIALMVLGLVDFTLLVSGFIASFFPDEFHHHHYSTWREPRPHEPSSHWPTDYTADVQAIQCHSHNDYWRPIPLKSAVRAGCSGVEADVWFFSDQSPNDLFVGHSRSALTPLRTFQSLYVQPLVEMLDRQNPITRLHRIFETPRNGVFDTTPEQTLVLLIDFKTDGEELWPLVSQQLEPLRKNKYLTYFNGSAIVEGPVTIVVTGNAPFNRVVENAHYRDMFFDAPLELLGNLAPLDNTPNTTSELNYTNPYNDAEERNYLAVYAAERASAAHIGLSSNRGQGHSGAAPKNPAVYTPANSYYASVSFRRSIGWGLPFLTESQKQKIRAQIQGAHLQGLKVRYWSTPGWPIGLRDHIWEVLVDEGIDYLNTDDLGAATRGHWWHQRRRVWSFNHWRF